MKNARQFINLTSKSAGRTDGTAQKVIINGNIIQIDELMAEQKSEF